ncbi:hypothetical protein AB0N87_39190 [Streptomyces sp. NPDC093228]|uniref:hypothetical protein n=1 Tax=unclassified Streptomyces TaxID=2593676 RepID=UPI0007410A98|nr:MULTISPECIES: hypothetical protein [unclassified Streptomyces]KUJ58470.1 hypothetical protein ADL25_02275 [Streptomyces sp. NRRL F-5122]REE60415.1 hypothetical protein BX257_2947 [Streptomyces sp. 3212.3]
MGQSQVAAVPPERIRYRLTPLQRLLPVLPGVLVIMGAPVLMWLDGGPLDPVLVSMLIAWGVLVPLLLITSRPFGITLTPSAAVVHNLRRRTIPWSNVQAIQVDSLFGSRTVVLYEAGGRRTRLRAPITGFPSVDRRFEEKFHTIGRWWLDHRGPDWVPVPPPTVHWGGPPAPDGNPYAPPA